MNFHWAEFSFLLNLYSKAPLSENEIHLIAFSGQRLYGIVPIYVSYMSEKLMHAMMGITDISIKGVQNMGRKYRMTLLAF